MTVSWGFRSLLFRVELFLESFAELDACALESGWKAFTVKLLEAVLRTRFLFLVCVSFVFVVSCLQ